MKENPSWFTWQDYETILAMCTASQTSENDFYLPQKKLRFLISGGIFMGSPWKLLTLNFPTSSKVANL